MPTVKEILWLPTHELINRFHAENPQEHSEEFDLPKIRHSLLNLGWLQYVTLQVDGSVISGHGRIMSADWFCNQTLDYFEKAWKRWLKENSDREAIADQNQERFNSGYWAKCPCIPVNLDILSQKSALIRLNDTQGDGRANPQRIAALLSQMPKQNQELSGWSPQTADNFIRGFLAKREQTPMIISDDEDENEELENPDELEVQDPEFQPSQDIGFHVAAENGDNPPPLPSGVIGVEMANINTDNFGDETLAVTQSDSYNPTGEQVRVLLYGHKEELPDFKKLTEIAADHLNVSTEGQAQEWRFRAIFEALKFVNDHFLNNE